MRWRCSRPYQAEIRDWGLEIMSATEYAIRNTQYPTIFKITNDVLDLDALLASITLPSTGAACVFTGMVRGVTKRGDAHETVYLEYEAYVPMAEAKMKQVADEIREKWNTVEGIAIVQRIGRLDPMTPTVLIACTAAHRDTGVFEAARYGIDRLKEIVPVWKKEVGPNGEEWGEGEYLPSEKDKACFLKLKFLPYTKKMSVAPFKF